MKHLYDYRDGNLAEALIHQIKTKSKKPVRIMEVCGGHTMAIRKYGIHSLLPPTIELLSGPGCPVCVTGREFIDKAVAYSRLPEFIITTYGDLIRVPGSHSRLDKEKSKGSDIRIIYSTLDALRIAKENPDKKVLFLGIGFETTTPPTAVAILQAEAQKLGNFFILSAHKIMPPAMSALIDDGSKIDGYIGPGHVSTIAGSKIYDSLAERYGISVVISGFEPVDILQSILMLVDDYEKNNPRVSIQYTRAVTYKGNTKAQQLVSEVFKPVSDTWRGIGAIPGSGMNLNDKYKKFHIEYAHPVKIDAAPEPKACLCGNILRGLNIPTDCSLFGKTCTPENPVGACMVSGEGSCAAYYKYN